MKIRSTTVIGVIYDNKVAFAADGQVTLGDAVVKHKAQKVRKLLDGKVLAGFAGSAADGFTLLDRFEGKLVEYSGNLERAAVELAKDWRTDRALRRLEAMLLVGNTSKLYILSGVGDVIQPDDGVAAIGSGGNFALSAAKALIRAETKDLTAEKIAKVGIEIASEICIYTNSNYIILTSD